MAGFQTPMLLLTGNGPCPGQIPRRGPYGRQISVEAHSLAFVGHRDQLARHGRGARFPQGLHAGAHSPAVHIHTIEEHAVAEHGLASQPELMVETAGRGSGPQPKRRQNAARSRRKWREHYPRGHRVAGPACLFRARVIPVARKVAGLVFEIATVNATVHHHADVAAGRQRAGGKRSVHEIEVRSAREHLPAERHFETAALELERPRGAKVHVRVFPFRVAFGWIARDFETNQLVEQGAAHAQPRPVDVEL